MTAFNVNKELEKVLGTYSDQRKFRKKTTDVKLKLDDVPVYKQNDDFQDWWLSFKDAIQANGLVGFTVQIEVCFRRLMEDRIRDDFKRLNIERRLTLKDMVCIVLCNYNRKIRTRYQYQEDLNVIQKKSNESVASYYLRFYTLSKLARNRDPIHLKELYLGGLGPEGLFKKVNHKMKKSSTISDAHHYALKYERKYFEEIQHREHQEKINKKQSKEERSNPKNKKDEKKPENRPEKRSNEDRKNKSQKQGKPKNSQCGYCGKDHDYKECKDKYPFFKPSEIKILKSINYPPRHRTDWPKYPITEETDFVKRARKNLAKKDTEDKKDNEKKQNHTNGDAKIQATLAQKGNPKAREKLKANPKGKKSDSKSEESSQSK
jgi:hypothetical protein